MSIPSARVPSLMVKPAILIQNTFSQIQRISPHGPLAVRSVCALKTKSGVHTQPWLCKRETNNSCSCTGQQFEQQRV